MGEGQKKKNTKNPFGLGEAWFPTDVPTDFACMKMAEIFGIHKHVTATDHGVTAVATSLQIQLVYGCLKSPFHRNNGSQILYIIIWLIVFAVPGFKNYCLVMHCFI